MGRLAEYKKDFLRAYNDTGRTLNFSLNNPEILKNSRSLITKLDYTLPTTSSLLNRNNSALEQLAMNLSWHVKFLKHPLKMLRLYGYHIMAPSSKVEWELLKINNSLAYYEKKSGQRAKVIERPHKT